MWTETLSKLGGLCCSILEQLVRWSREWPARLVRLLCALSILGSDIPVSTREEARESRPHPEEPGFHLVALDDGFFSSFVWKEFPAFPSQLKRRRSQQEKREKPQCRATIPRDPQMSVHSRGTCFPCTDSTFTPRIHSLHHGMSHVGQPCGKASSESLEGKPQIP